jgi:signal transduction histidine kinase
LKNNKSFFTVGAVSSIFILLGLITYGVIHNYEIASAIAAIGIAIPMFVSSIYLWKSRISNKTKVLSCLLFLNALHFLDYPFLRSHPSGALWGFSIALLLLFSFSAFFPGYILLQISEEYSLGLEIEVKKRTAELVETLDQNKVLVNILCHDLSSPLTVLGFCIDEMFENNLSASQIEYGEKAKRSLGKMLTIVKKVKDLQAITYKKKKVNLDKINLFEVLEEVMTDFKDICFNKNIILKLTNQKTKAVEILGDKDILRNHILSNLLSNAIKFSYQNSVINLEINEDENFVHLLVKDHGTGIPKELLPKIFNWNEETTRNGTNGEKGTGLGMPLVKTCVEMIGASIRVESQTKESPDSESGSKFIIQFDKLG